MSTAGLTLLHARYQALETVRVPIAVLGTMLFPSLAMFFFVVPQSAVAQNPVAATAAVGQLAMFSVMSTCMFTFGVGAAEDRALPFDPYVRTLPAGPAPRLLGRMLTGGGFALLGLVPLILIAWIFTAATVTAGQALVSLAVVIGVALPFLGLGLGIGYSMSSKAAIAVVQVVLFPMAFAGGLFMPPEVFPDWLDRFSQALPSRAGRDLLVQALTDAQASAAALPVLLAWGALFAAFAVWAYRRDEGRRFR
ncbi:ABC transporter permease [Cellulomonas sp. APG4]|uniref:ABC transporter permease n=1 Tax=Cellulomonas sp. APG4 TaxID=1538656 RepID=UPI00137AD171|nr:ABC transporter permease [Cellulomonas sp. APG4]NCT92118.1 ABC transporter permease [Cellulomonas sp. APG4]